MGLNWSYERQEMVAQLRQRDAVLKKLEKRLERNAPYDSETQLYVRKQKGYNRYFVLKNGKEFYLSRKNKNQEKELLRLAQSDYDSRAYQLIQKERRLLQLIIRRMEQPTVEDLYEGLAPGRQKLITPVLPSRKQFVDEWMNQDYQKRPVDSGAGKPVSLGSVDVRSRIEALVAMRFEHYGVPMLYEFPVRVPAVQPAKHVTGSDDYLRQQQDGMITIRPDFAVLNCRTQKVYYFEVFGMLDDPAYAEETTMKLLSYELAGLQNQLLYIFAGNGHNLDMSLVDKLIETHLL